MPMQAKRIKKRMKRMRKAKMSKSMAVKARIRGPISLLRPNN